MVKKRDIAATTAAQMVSFDKVGIKTVMLQSGYESTKQLSDSTNCKLSYESIRRAVAGYPISTWTMFLILDSLNLPKKKVKKILKDAGDTILTPYFDGEKDIDPCAGALIDLFNKVMIGIDDNSFELLTTVMSSIASRTNKDITKELEALSNACSL
jgi:peptidyl-tRNA hydrolase